jgi:hypothetical protein
MLLSMNKVRSALVYKRMSCTRQLSLFNRKPKMRLIEECWTDSHLLAPGIRELAFLQKLRESTGTRLKPSLASLERLQATCLYEKENIYAYVTTRALIDLYPEEFNKGGYLFSNSVESLHAMQQYESLNSLVTPAVWRNYTRKWKGESEGETSSSSSRVVSALLEATLRGGGGGGIMDTANLALALQRCDIVLSGLLNEASRVASSSSCSPVPVLVQADTLRAVSNLYALQEAAIAATGAINGANVGIDGSGGAMLLEEYIASNVILLYHRALGSLQDGASSALSSSSSGTAPVPDIAVLLSCMHSPHLLRQSIAFYQECFSNTPNGLEHLARLVTTLLYDLHPQHQQDPVAAALAEAATQYLNNKDDTINPARGINISPESEIEIESDKGTGLAKGNFRHELAREVFAEHIMASASAPVSASAVNVSGRSNGSNDNNSDTAAPVPVPAGGYCYPHPAPVPWGAVGDAYACMLRLAAHTQDWEAFDELVRAWEGVCRQDKEAAGAAAKDRSRRRGRGRGKGKHNKKNDGKLADRDRNIAQAHVKAAALHSLSSLLDIQEAPRTYRLASVRTLLRAVPGGGGGGGGGGGYHFPPGGSGMAESVVRAALGPPQSLSNLRDRDERLLLPAEDIRVVMQLPFPTTVHAADVGVAVVEWALHCIDTDHSAHGKPKQKQKQQQQQQQEEVENESGLEGAWLPPLDQDYDDDERKEEGPYARTAVTAAPRHKRLSEAQRRLLSTAVLCSAQHLLAHRHQHQHRFTQYCVHRLSSAAYRHPELLTDLVAAIVGAGAVEHALPLTALEQATYGCASASHWEGVTSLFSVFLSSAYQQQESNSSSGGSNVSAGPAQAPAGMTYYLAHALLAQHPTEPGKAARALLMMAARPSSSDGGGGGSSRVLPSVPLSSFIDVAVRVAKVGTTATATATATTASSGSKDDRHKQQQQPGVNYNPQHPHPGGNNNPQQQPLLSSVAMSERLWQAAEAMHGPSALLALPEPYSYRNSHTAAAAVLPSLSPDLAAVAARKGERYSLKEALARLPAAHRARWLARAAAVADQDQTHQGRLVELLDAHLDACEQHYSAIATGTTTNVTTQSSSSLSPSSSMGPSSALLALQEVYLATIVAILRADLSSGKYGSGSGSGSSGTSASEGAMVYLKRLLLSSQRLQTGATMAGVGVGAEAGAGARRGAVQRRRVQRVYDLILEEALREGRGLRAASLIRELQQALEAIGECGGGGGGGGDDGDGGGYRNIGEDKEKEDEDDDDGEAWEPR